MKDYALKITQLSKYVPTMVANLRDEMSRFLMGVSNLAVKECRSAMLHHDKDISRLELVMGTSPMLGPMNKVNLGSNKGFPTKVPLMHPQGSTTIGCLTLNLKEEMEAVLLLKDLNVPSVAKNMRVSA